MPCEICGKLKTRLRDHADMEPMNLCQACYHECVDFLENLEDCRQGQIPLTDLPNDIVTLLLLGRAKDEDGNNLNERIYR